MPLRPQNLPDYNKPPLIEVALAVQFDELSSFRSVHAGLLWDLFRKQFPKYSEQPEIPPKFETFSGDRRAPTGPQIKFVQTQSPSVPRYWFIDKNDAQLIQFQQDRLVHNWRKNKEDETYPRYELIKKKFVSELTKVNRFLKANELGNIVPNQVEITYVNLIGPIGNRDPWTCLGDIFNNWKNCRYPSKFGLIEHAGFNMQFVAENSELEPLGRLFISAKPVMAQGEPNCRLELVFRGAPEKQTLKAAGETLDIGRERIIHAFTEMTTQRMHKIWGRKK